MRASGYDRVVSDFYVEPRWLVDALLDVEPLVGTCWDPSCGSGNIVMALRDRGLLCWGSDIANRGFYGAGVMDFLTTTQIVGNIVTNPPYGIIEEYIRHALPRTKHKVCILARLALLEGQKRRALFRETPLARVWVSSRRASMPPGGTDIAAKGGTIAYAWFVFEHGHVGAPVIGWV